MLNREILQTRTSVHPGRFAVTSWTAVAAASGGDSPAAQEALAGLCQTYWPPLHAYVRRLGHSEEDAQDLTQEFFHVLIRKNYLGAADRQKGKFRTFLLTALRHFLANEWDKSRAQKRGAGQPVISLDEPLNEDGFMLEPATDLSPVKLFERQWARTLFAKAIARLRDEYRAAGKEDVFQTMKGFLEDTTPPGGYEEAARSLNLSVGTLRVSVHRMRQRTAELVREEVASTLVQPTPEEIEAEVEHLFAAFRPD